MLRDFLISFVNTNFLYSIFICFFFGLTIIRAHNFFCRSFREASKYKNNIQTIHEGQISRLGGITIVFSFLYYEPWFLGNFTYPLRNTYFVWCGQAAKCYVANWQGY